MGMMAAKSLKKEELEELFKETPSEKGYVEGSMMLLSFKKSR